MNNNLIIIPARSGSTRVINKNLQEINGKSLLQTSIETALQSAAGRVFVSTNCEEISCIAKKYSAEVPFLRPQEYSTSTSTSLSVILHALIMFKNTEDYQPDNIIFKPPTNPFLKPETIQKMATLKDDNPSTDSVLSIYQPRCNALSFVGFDIETRVVTPEIYDINGTRLYDFERSQDRPSSYAGSPACKITNSEYFRSNYSFNPESILNAKGATYNLNSCIGFEITRNESFDIDDNQDLLIAQNNHSYLCQ